MTRVLPRPRMTVALMIVWAMLQNSVAPGTWLMGACIGWLIPFTLNPLLLEREGRWYPWKLARLLVVVLGDIIVSNFHVARLNLGPVHRLRPTFLEVPIDLTSDTARSVLVSIVSMTPGTLAADLSEDKKILLVHGLDIADPDAVIREIKERYEAPLKEIYPC